MNFKTSFFITLAFGMLITLFHATAQKQTESMDSLSYSVGILVATNLKSQGIEDINAQDLSLGISDVINGKNPRINMEDANRILQDYMTRQQDKMKQEASKVGAEFLAQNAKRKGVVVLPSGLQYEIMKEGTGEKPKATDKVKTHYHGTLIDGTVFDSSVNRGEPATFPVNGVIKGWVEALQLMPVGSKWKLFVPYDLAYGERGAGAMIKPYSTLIFEVELLEIVK
jgi:FKBP-type peptidyl-prolyl cis-trans isomerase FklB